VVQQKIDCKEGDHMSDIKQEELRSSNVNTVQQVYAAFAKRDIKAILSMLSPDVEWGEPPNPFNPAAGTRQGHAGFLEWLNIGRQSEEILVLEPRKFLTDNDTVAVVGYTKCLAKPTGKSYETDFVHLVTIKDGKIVRFQEFFDTYAAAEAFRQP
jgi:ketosteroid isomerase-like protein